MNSIKKTICDKIATTHVARFRKLLALFENEYESPEQKKRYAKEAVKEFEKVEKFDPIRYSLMCAIYNTRILDIYAGLS